MKKTFAVMLALILLFSLASCKGKEDVVSSSSPAEQTSAAPIGTEALNTEEATPAPTGKPLFREYNDNVHPNIWMTDESIYCVVDPAGFPFPRVMFCDREYREWMPLCGRPDCMHRDTGCSAFFDGTSDNTMYIFGDHIYYFAEELLGDGYDGDGFSDLWRMGLDGSDHEKVLHLLPEGGELESGEMSCSFWFLGSYAVFYYYYFDASDIADWHGSTDDDVKRAGTVYQYYLVDLREEAPSLVKVHEGDFEHRFFLGHACAGRGNVIWSFRYNFDTMFDDVQTSSILCRTDLDSGDYEELCELPFDWGNSDSELVGSTLYTINSEKGELYSIDVDTGEYTVKEGAVPVRSSIFDRGDAVFDRYITYHIYNGIIYVVDAFDGDAEKPVRFYDMDGNPICSVENGAEQPIRLHSVIGDYIFGCNDRQDSGVRRSALLPEWYLDLSELGTESFGWKKWEP